MSSAAGQKFLNENLHRTAVMASHIPTMSPRKAMQASGNKAILLKYCIIGVILHYIALHYITLHYIILYYIILCHSMLLYITLLYYILLQYITYIIYKAAMSGGGGPGTEGRPLYAPPTSYPLYVRLRAVVADWAVPPEKKDEFLAWDLVNPLPGRAAWMDGHLYSSVRYLRSPAIKGLPIDLASTFFYWGKPDIRKLAVPMSIPTACAGEGGERQGASARERGMIIK